MRKDGTTNTETETASREYRLRRHALNVALMATTALFGLSAMQSPALSQTRPAAAAASARPSFNIPAQSLSQALVQFSTASGVQVFVNAGVVSGINSPGASGALTPAVALNRLLTGTGLTYRFTNANTVAIERPGATTAPGGAVPAGAIALDTIDVQGASNPNSTMTLMPAYAGGQVATGGQLGMLGNRSVMNTPFSTTNYTNKVIQNQQAQTVQDVLSNDPSVLTAPSGTGRDWESETIRGFKTYSWTGSRALNGLAGMAPLTSPMMDPIERVEILKGPSALLNGMTIGGALAQGGSVNLVTKSASDEPITELTTRYNSRSQVGAHLDIGRRFGSNNEFGMRFNGAFGEGGTPINPQRAELGSAALNLDYRGERVRISTDFMYVSNDYRGCAQGNMLSVRFASGVPKAVDASRCLHPSWTYQNSESILGMARGEFDITDSITAYASIGAQKNRSNSIMTISQLDYPTGRYVLYPIIYDRESHILSMQAGVRAKISTGPIDHSLNVSLSKSDFDVSGNPSALGTPFDAGTIYNPIFPSVPNLPDRGRFGLTNETKTSGIGFADTLSILEERVQLTAGIRYQTVAAENFSAVTGQSTSNYESNAWTPALGIVLKPWEKVSLYANYIEGLQPGTVVGGTYANAGEAFSPYVSKQYETGVKVDWGMVTTTMAVFQIAKPNAIAIADPNGGLPRLSLDGEQRNRGIEFNAYGEVFESVRLLGGVTFLDARQTRTANGQYDGARAENAPKFRAVVGAEWDAPFLEGLTFTGRFTYTGNQVVDNSTPDFTIPSWTTVDLGARYTFVSPLNSRPVTIRFSVDNVFNKSYWANAENSWISYGQPRTFRLSTAFKF